MDSRHTPTSAWSHGNLVRPLVHGATYFAELAERVNQTRRGDLLLFVDWRGDPDERLTGEAGSEVATIFAAAARRGVDVRGLIWRSHWDRLAFSNTENRTLQEGVNAAGGQCLLDMRVRTGGSHHQKFVVLRHPGRPENDVAFVGGIDLCHSRRDDAAHHGDPQRQSMAAAYGPRPAWHDVQLCLTGPVVGDIETVFRERWEDPQRMSRSPLRRTADALRHDPERPTPLPPQLPDPQPTGPHPVQVLRTYPRRLGGYPFAPQGERSVARGCRKALRGARELIYVEDQYLWSVEVASAFADALRRRPELRMVAVLPLRPDQDGRFSMPPNLAGRDTVIRTLREAAPGRVAFYGIENAEGRPIYVHAKVSIVDDSWASVGSDNFNRRSWTHDSEISAAVAHEDYARGLRDELVREHLGLEAAAPAPARAEVFDAFADAAAALEQWHRTGRRGPRPPGQLRPLVDPPLGRVTRAWAELLYRTVYDPDGRPLPLRVMRRL
nr:phospholipase D family protein [Pedococcus badiiscoriae]